MILLDKLLKLVRAVRRPVQLVWALPVTLPCFLFYILPCWVLGWYRYYGKVCDSWVWLHGSMPKWFSEMWIPWSGQCVGNCIVMKNDPRSSPRDLQLLAHELHHTKQVMIWGPLQPIFYSLSGIALWMAGEDTYETNPFEIAARRASGQKINID